MKSILFFLTVITVNLSIAQKTCESPQESLEDLNSITKCSINYSKNPKDKKSRQISVKVSASKKRYLKKRTLANKAIASSATSLSTSGVSETDHSSAMSSALSLKENNSNTIANLSNSLSAEEVRKASKFNAVNKIPLFNACKGTKKDKALNCFNTEMIKHIQKHFNYPNDAIIEKKEGDVWVRFIIDKNGNVSNIKGLGPVGGDVLVQEATRVVSKLPKFIPGVKDGKKTSVKYGFPISFSLEN